MTNPELVTALDLDQWASSLTARSALPVLVRRLILATASVTEIAIRGGEGTGLPGWDGLVTATVEDPHVPVGASGWELGTSADSRDKAQSDYRARTNDPLGVDPATTTFVAVTPRRWRDRDEWRNARKSDGPWADVRAYDADDLETWLERAPSVHVWISELLGREPRDVRTPDRWWATWASQTHPALPCSFLLAGRDHALSKLRDALRQSSQVISVVAPSREEAVAVVCASLVDDSEDVDEFASRAVIVSGAGAWERLVDSDAGLVLIPTLEDLDVQAALSRGHRVVVPVAKDVRPRGVAVHIPPLDRLKATEALIQTTGLGRDVADRYAAHARRSLLSLRRTIAVSPAFMRPAWSQSPQGGRLVPLLLAGSWTQDSDGDRETIASLTGRAYTDVEPDLAAWSALEDAPLRRSGQTWRIVSKDDAWDLISPLITPTDLSRFFETAVRVLQEPDPALDLPPERRFMAAVVGEPRKWSPRLRASIADTIAFLGGYGGDHELPDGGTAQQYADRLVWAVTKDLSTDSTGRAWQSLADVMPLLAEASPDRFLDAVEAGLAGDSPVLRTMFLESEPATSFGASSPHIALIWALETLCWRPDYLSRAASALARLADIDPEPQGRSNPRPAGSLAHIFSLYWPQTSASLQRRLIVLDRLQRYSPAAAWSLFRAILPAPGFGIPSHRPRWRPWAQDHSDEINPADVVAGAAEIVTRLIEGTGDDAQRWNDLVGSLHMLPISDRDRVLAALETLNPDRLGDEGKTALWRALLEVSGRHRQFAGAAWAMPGDVLDRIDHIAARFAPASLIDLYTDLFDHHPRLPDVDPRDYVASENALRLARQRAVSALLDGGGTTDLLGLGSAVTLPRAVGWAVAEARGDQLADELLRLLGVDGSDGQVASGYAAGRINEGGLEWIEQRFQQTDVTWSAVQQAGLLLAVLRPSLPLLAVAGRRPPDAQELFWQRMNPAIAELDARPAIARELIEHRRPWAAINALMGLLPSGGQAVTPPDVDLVELTLHRAVTGPADDAQYAPSLAWEVEQLLDYLENAGSDIETRARLEFQFMPLLEFSRPARALGAALQAQPTLFAEIMSIVYRAEGEPADAPVPAERQALADVGIRALKSWHMPPGLQSDGTMDIDQLRAWVDEARRLLADSGRRVIGDLVIGEVLVYVPAEGDGLWPPLSLRDLLEDLESTDLERGLQTGKFNSRGLIARDAFSGGEQERALAAQFREWATRVADQWPRSAALLRGMAASYEAWGRGEDDRSEDYQDRGR